ncbi:hypothetical protein EJM73_09105 [Clostridium botulinum]|uniref:hypothetical protein n=1 Tax=Clostridium botulinum TaxID=1491 RepID=UPI0013764087|nr:hypothetical protein [Clostridium botulinum]NCI19783.1 hypothetical protein [Clostridium botulinum]NCI35821.1 hypothetical protein [Clostridium botulinum]NCI71678.1 hypothetical protein [Clostridium botulinum]NDI38870.1 hypothetical protein [Clostridium botulinum]HCL4447254.1 hypothetical protein [Clostridium botulinum]
MSKLKSKEIDYIVDTYKRLKSIEKTAKETGFSKITVNKYVRDISSTDKRSRYCKNKISQIDVNTNQTIKEWNKPSIAAKELNINPAEICRVLKGELKQAGGYSWKYK